MINIKHAKRPDFCFKCFCCWSVRLCPVEKGWVLVSLLSLLPFHTGKDEEKTRGLQDEAAIQEDQETRDLKHQLGFAEPTVKCLLQMSKSDLTSHGGSELCIGCVRVSSLTLPHFQLEVLRWHEDAAEGGSQIKSRLKMFLQDVPNLLFFHRVNFYLGFCFLPSSARTQVFPTVGKHSSDS